MLATLPYLEPIAFPPLRRDTLETLQVNLGYRCNQQCRHCHVNAGPKRTEMMEDAVVDDLLTVIAALPLTTVDITGGAPELHPRFRDIVRAARTKGLRVFDRCNLTVLNEPGQGDTAAFLAEQGVEVIASLPCYLEENVDTQRGKGTFDSSITGLRQLNALGYGRTPELRLNLVYNPQGPSLPPPQGALQSDYRRILDERYGIVFDQLFTLANMPIARFGSELLSKKEFDGYMTLLRDAFDAANLNNVMCRNLVSVDWRGRLFDCDFNQMLDLPMPTEASGCELTLKALLEVDMEGRPIRTAGHCYGCTAGQGSSCGGALG